ncbi:hypothetical protein FSP39_018581 [Pinctada imbricata]|uniref:T-box domain-containing protein n=1 Tax=Pinctada imbricata TaxID=66713 RepID=A0AA89BW30_PINIB|nr:hypothetical protein FSP39_018581 [Pinctada imbricata]
MIITKSGRRMFPAIRVKLHGLKSDAKYKVWIEFLQLDQQKYRYVYHSSKWMVAGSGDVMVPNQAYQHPDSPVDGAFVQSQLVSFERIKLTNHDKPRPGQISLLSMQRFVPRIRIQETQVDDFEEESPMFTDSVRVSYIDRPHNFLYHIGTVPVRLTQNTNLVRVKCPSQQHKSILPDVKPIVERNAYQDFLSACQSKLISTFYPH